MVGAQRVECRRVGFPAGNNCTLRELGATIHSDARNLALEFRRGSAMVNTANKPDGIPLLSHDVTRQQISDGDQCPSAEPAPDAWPHLSMSAIVERSLLATVSVAGKPNSEASATHPSGQQEHILGFHTEAEAIAWRVSQGRRAWLETRGYVGWKLGSPVRIKRLRSQASN
jgi:hypothetical protein